MEKGNDYRPQHHRGKAVGGQPWRDGHQQPQQRGQVPPQVLRLQLLLSRDSTQGQYTRVFLPHQC